MNHRPIVLPGLVTGVVLLAAMVGFTKLPADANTPAAAANTSASQATDLSLCRSTMVNLEAMDLKGLVRSGDVNTLGSALQQYVQSAGQNVSDPTLSKTVQDPFADFVVTTVRTITGLQSSQKVTDAESAKLLAAYDKLAEACNSIGA